MRTSGRRLRCLAAPSARVGLVTLLLATAVLAARPASGEAAARRPLAASACGADVLGVAQGSTSSSSTTTTRPRRASKGAPPPRERHDRQLRGGHHACHEPRPRRPDRRREPQRRRRGRASAERASRTARRSPVRSPPPTGSSRMPRRRSTSTPSSPRSPRRPPRSGRWRRTGPHQAPPTRSNCLERVPPPTCSRFRPRRSRPRR